MPRALIRRQKVACLLAWMALMMFWADFLREALQGNKVALGQVVQVADILHQAHLHQLLDDLFSQAVDVHGGSCRRSA